MKIIAKFNPTKVITIFKKYYPDIKPKTIYRLSDGYLVYAPRFSDETDYNDPYYFVDNKTTIAHLFDLKKRKQFFDALESDPIWKDGK